MSTLTARVFHSELQMLNFSLKCTQNNTDVDKDVAV